MTSPSQASGASIFAALRSYVTKLWNIEDFVYEWDEYDFTELLEDSS